MESSEATANGSTSLAGLSVSSSMPPKSASLTRRSERSMGIPFTTSILACSGDAVSKGSLPVAASKTITQMVWIHDCSKSCLVRTAGSSIRAAPCHLSTSFCRVLSGSVGKGPEGTRSVPFICTNTTSPVSPKAMVWGQRSRSI